MKDSERERKYRRNGRESMYGFSMEENEAERQPERKVIMRKGSEEKGEKEGINGRGKKEEKIEKDSKRESKERRNGRKW